MLRAAVAYNLKKLLNFKAPKVVDDVKTMRIKAEITLLNFILNYRHSLLIP